MIATGESGFFEGQQLPLVVKEGDLQMLGGAACDFIVLDESILEVAQWIVENTPFDRLYFYGDDKPLHVSYGPENNRAVVVMHETDAGKLIPRNTKTSDFLMLNS